MRARNRPIVDAAGSVAATRSRTNREKRMGKTPLRLPRDARAVTRRATPSTRDAIASSCTAAHRSMRDSRLTESYGTTRPRSRRASRAFDARIERNVFSAIRSRARVASRSTASSSARRVASPVASGGRAPRRLFSSPPAKIFARACVRRVHRWMARPEASLVVDVRARRARITNPRGFRGARARSRRSRSSRGDRRAFGARAMTTTTTCDADGIARDARMRVRIHAFRREGERISRVTVREPNTPWVGPRSRRAARVRAGPDSYEWVGIFTVHDPSFSVLIFLIFPQRTREARVACAERARRSLSSFASRASSAHGVARTADDRRERRSGSVAKEFDRREPAE